MYRTLLVVGAEVQSTGMDVTTRGRNTAVIFADGAGAAVVQATDAPGGSAILGWDLHGDGQYAEQNEFEVDDSEQGSGHGADPDDADGGR